MLHYFKLGILVLFSLILYLLLFVIVRYFAVNIENSLFFSYLFASIGYILFLNYRYKYLLEIDFKLPSSFLKSLLGISALFFGYQYFSNIIQTGNTIKIGFNGSEDSIQNIISSVVIAPVIQEIIFRRFPLEYSLKQKKSINITIIISSLLFSFSHAPTTANKLIYTFLLGLFLSKVYIKERNTVQIMMLHLVNNFLAYFFISSSYI